MRWYSFLSYAGWIKTQSRLPHVFCLIFCFCFVYDVYSVFRRCYATGQGIIMNEPKHVNSTPFNVILFFGNLFFINYTVYFALHGSVSYVHAVGFYGPHSWRPSGCLWLLSVERFNQAYNISFLFLTTQFQSCS